MKINAIQCLNCKDTIFSRARHDYRSCSCGNCSIDGGFDYIKIGFKNEKNFIQKQIKLNVTKTKLYNDWNSKTDIYGLIKENEKTSSNVNVRTSKKRKVNLDRKK